MKMKVGLRIAAVFSPSPQASASGSVLLLSPHNLPKLFPLAFRAGTLPSLTYTAPRQMGSHHLRLSATRSH